MHFLNLLKIMSKSFNYIILSYFRPNNFCCEQLFNYYYVKYCFLTTNTTQKLYDHDNLDESECIYQLVFGVCYFYLAKYNRTNCPYKFYICIYIYMVQYHYFYLLIYKIYKR